MNRFWVLAVLWHIVGSTAWADDSSTLPAEVDPMAGCVWLSISPDEKNWLNGALVDVQSDVCIKVKLKPGDTLVTAKGMAYWDTKPILARTFESFRLDRINGKVAWFTQRTYSVKTTPYGQEGFRIFPDKLLKTCNRPGGEVELTDGGPWDSIYPVGYHLGSSVRTK